MDLPHAMPEDDLVEALRAEIEGLLEFMYVCPVGLVEIAPDGAVGMMNPLAAQLLLPVARGPAIPNLFDAMEGVAPELRFMAASFAAERGTVCQNHRVHVQQGTDDEVAVVLACTIIKIDARRLMVVLSDISRQVAQERRLRQAESWFSALMTGVNDFALLSLDANGRIASWNESGLRQTGYAATEVVGRTLNLFYYPEEAVQGRALQQVEMARRDGWHIDEGWRRRRDGSRYWCQSLVSAMKEDKGEIQGFSAILRDVTEQKITGDEIKRLLTTDHLTGVTNRARFFELAEAEEVRWQRFRQPLSAIMIDVDHFKRVNDLHGHAAGDEVLKAVAACCARCLRATDVLGRLGGEEFAIILPALDLHGAGIVAERIRTEIRDLAVEVEGRRIPVTASLGCATLAGEVASLGALLRAADGALYRAKEGGRDRVTVHGPLDQAA